VKLMPGACSDVPLAKMLSSETPPWGFYGDLIDSENRRDGVVRRWAACGYSGRQPVAFGRV
jgi:hypothetical protein